MAVVAQEATCTALVVPNANALKPQLVAPSLEVTAKAVLLCVFVVGKRCCRRTVAPLPEVA